MVYPVFVIRDRKADFWQPRVEMNVESAKRWFGMLVNNSDPGNVVAFSPHDFELYRIGDYDGETGDIFPLDKKEFVISGENLVGVGYEK